MSNNSPKDSNLPSWVEVVNGHIKTCWPLIQSMTDYELECNVEKLRAEFNLSCSETDRRHVLKRTVAPLEPGETTGTLLERIQSRKKRSPNKPRKKMTAREKLEKLGIFTKEQLDAMPELK